MNTSPIIQGAKVMFQTLTNKLKDAFASLKGQTTFNEKNIQHALTQVELALIEADVALEVIDHLLQEIKATALNSELKKGMKPHEALIQMVHDQLVTILGGSQQNQNLIKTRPNQLSCILVAGLQGSGKTTSVVKLAKFLMQEYQLKIMVASCDVYRPAAIHQLETLANQVNCGFYTSQSQDPQTIAQGAQEQAQKEQYDLLIIDTAGRLHIDQTMMDELKTIHKCTAPTETLFVIDAMMGQEALATAQAFNKTVPLSGIILTKTDGDARGGAALCAKYITGQPIKFIGQGEQIDAIDYFDPERIAGQILGMGDIVALARDAERKIDKQKAERAAKKFQSGGMFDLQDYRELMEQMLNMGGLGSILSKMPGMGNMAKMANQHLSDQQLKTTCTLIDSMTPKERLNPGLLKMPSRAQRVTRGAGLTAKALGKLLKEFEKTRKMMQKFSGGKMRAMLQMMQSQQSSNPLDMLKNLKDMGK
jgi:signal recognition particle subunit SRP54